MYEAEVNSLREPASQLPPEILERFQEMRGQIEARTILPWGEHCTECNWPSCYTSCELYTPRADGGCRLFLHGMVRLDHPAGSNPFLIKIQFKRWGKLWTVGNTNLLPVPVADAKQQRNIVVGAVARNIPVPTSLRVRMLQRVAHLRRQTAEKTPSVEAWPDYFLLECYNPNPRTITLTFTVRHRTATGMPPFLQKVTLPPGFARTKIAMAELTGQFDLQQPFEVEIVPNDCENTVLFFGFADFVKERVTKPAQIPAPAQKWKCIVWDLDNTLWDGVLLEDGANKLRLNQAVVDVIKETDRRGILHSIASKNNPDEALKVLQAVGLEEYFLYPQIGWQPKSQSLERIAQSLNIGIDTLAFVDDQKFEQEEVRANLPQVTIVNAADSSSILRRPECQVPITAESQERRAMYRQQVQREAVLQSTFKGDYAKFLRECEIELRLTPLRPDNLDRVYELAQRTNQMNFSGNRYPREKLKELLESSNHKTYVMQCKDKFGNYGIVGFGVVDLTQPRLLDLMFSCRIQSKRVEHAFLGHLLRCFVGDRGRDLLATYRQTEKNVQSGKVFTEIGFEIVETVDGETTLIFRKDRPISDDQIIRIKEDEGSAA